MPDFGELAGRIKCGCFYCIVDCLSGAPWCSG